MMPSKRAVGGFALVAAAALTPGILHMAGPAALPDKSTASSKPSAATEAADYFLNGKNEFLAGDYKKAVESFEKAVSISPDRSEYELWLGRAYGRRAEKSAWLSAPPLASKARQSFEKAVALDPHNRDARDDLFDFYLNAPAFLGGGLAKAAAAAKSLENEMPAEYESEEAQLAERRNDYPAAEAHLRRAVALAPDETDLILDLAQNLAKQGRVTEADQLFDQAKKMAHDQPKVAFAEANSDVETHHNLDQARALLRAYLRASLNPDDPPRQEAEKLLRRAGGGS